MDIWTWRLPLEEDKISWNVIAMFSFDVYVVGTKCSMIMAFSEKRGL